MKRFLAVTLAASTLGLGAFSGACDTYDDRGDGYYGGRGYRDPCMQYTTCGSCTPVVG